MQTIQNVDYFETQLNAQKMAESNPAVDPLVSDMVAFARNLEVVIPPAENGDSKPKPGASAQFRPRIDQLASSISAELLATFNAFLTYIEVLENSAPQA